MIVLVVSMHAADTYSPLGNWYFLDRRPLTVPVLLSFAAWQMYLQAFFMGLLFFIAGYFVPSSLQRKGVAKFLRERASRLGLPVVFYMFVLGPVTEYFVAHSWNSTEPTSFANEWIKHIRNGQFLQENGPLWFCLALLIFSACYAAVEKTIGSEDNDAADVTAPSDARLSCFALVIAAATFVVRLVFPSGTSVLNMQLGDFPQYVLLFIGGVGAARGGWLRNPDYARGLAWLAITVPVGFVMWLAILTSGGALTGEAASLSGGLHWQAAAIDVWESFTCIGIGFGLLAIFNRVFNSQGRFARSMSENAFSVYVFHPPFVIIGARLLHSVAWQPLLKFVALTIAATASTFLFSAALVRKVPGLRVIV